MNQRLKSSRVFEISVDDGDKLDFKSAELLRKLGLKATFFVPLSSELMWEEIKELGKEFEIGGHTATHPQDLKKLRYNRLKEEIYDARIRLEIIAERDIRDFCYPRGRHNERVINAVKGAGFITARTTQVLAIDYDDPYRKPTTIHVYDRRKEYNGRGWEYWANKLWRLRPRYFHIWWHSWEVERDGLWEGLERFLTYAKDTSP